MQRSCVLHFLSLCGVLKHVHTSARLGVASSSVSEHYRTLKNGDIQASALAEHVFKTGHAVDLSLSEVLDHHQHTTTRCMLESWYIQQNEAVLNREWGILPKVYATLLDWCTHIHLAFLFLFNFFLLYIGFVSIVNNLTQLCDAWDHVACMYKGTPGLIGMSSPHLIYTVWVFSTAIHWWQWLYGHQNVWITVKPITLEDVLCAAMYITIDYSQCQQTTQV